MGRMVLVSLVVLSAFVTSAASAAEAVSPLPAAPPGDISRVTPLVLAYRRARPAVVNISTEKIITTGGGMFGRDQLEDIFPSPFTRRVPVQSLGSGFLVNPAGYIVTNAHVVRRAQTITVTLSDQTKLPAQIISSDSTHDLAVIKIEPPDGRALDFLPLGRSDDLMVGETVVAIGNPMGLSHTATSGIVSALDRKLEFDAGVAYEGLIQVDAPINAGNSGGPLLNIRGELIGINTAIRADAQNIGFAIPVDALMRQFPDLLNFERINRVVFGARVSQHHAAAGDQLYVESVRPGTPAVGKLAPGDRVLALNGREMKQITDFTCTMLAAGPTAKADLKILRGPKQLDETIAVLAKPRPDGKLLAQALFGATFRPVTPQLARELRLPLEKGLMVTALEADSPAGHVGLQVKDVVFQFANFYINDLDSLGFLLEEIDSGKPMRIGVVRGTVATWVQIDTRAKPAATSGPGPKATPKSAPKLKPRPGETAI